MAKERDIEKIITLTGEKDEDLIELLLDDAEEFVKSYTGRKNIVTGLEKAVRDLAVIALNRMGTEEKKREVRVERIIPLMTLPNKSTTL